MRFKRLVLPVLLGLAVAAGLVCSLLRPHWLGASLLEISAWFRSLGPAGWLLFVLAQALGAVIGFVPGSLLGVAAGAVYGIGAGFAASVIGVLAGALLAFGLSRSICRPLIAGLVGERRRLAALDGLLVAEKWRIVLLLRVSPVMPFSLTSYALGLSSVSVRDYLLGTLGSLPALLGFVVIGALGHSTLAARSRDADWIHIAVLAAGVAATLLLTLRLSRLLGRAVRTV